MPVQTAMSVLEVKVHRTSSCGHYNTRFVSFHIDGPGDRIAQSKRNLSVRKLVKEHNELQPQYWSQLPYVMSAPIAVP